MRRLLDYDPLTGLETYFIEQDDQYYVQELIDPAPIIDRNKALQNRDSLPNGDVRLVAEIPFIVWQRLCLEAGIPMFGREADELIAKVLADPDYKWLKTIPGRA